MITVRLSAAAEYLTAYYSSLKKVTGFLAFQFRAFLMPP